MEVLAQLSNVGVSFGSNDVLTDISLTLAAGECLGVAGANGSGKTTLLRVIATLQVPTLGSVDVLSREMRPRAHIGFVGHEPSLNPFLTLQENLEFVADLRDIDADQVTRALIGVGIDPVAGRRSDTASQGMRRRADLARVAITRPTLLLLDEPYSGLDTEAGTIVDRLISNTTKRGGAVVVVSHHQDTLERISDSVIFL